MKQGRAVLPEVRLRLTWPGRDALALPEPRRFAGDLACPNRLYHADNLDVLLYLRSGPPIDLIYIDPPFNTGTKRKHSGELEGGSYADTHSGMAAYLTLMLPRLRLMHELLAPHGALYLHCDYRASSQLRLLLDEIFGEDNFRAEIVWHYQSGGRQKRCWSMKHDIIWMYSKSERFTFNLEAVGVRRGGVQRNHMKRINTADGKSAFTIRSGGRIYTYSEDDLLTPADVWTDISHLQQKDPERTGYATQKPQKLIERIVLASSNPGELVADFYCGSGTTGVVAHKHGRRFVLSDSSPIAIATTEQRLKRANASFATITPEA